MSGEKKSTSWNNRLAKAETLLILALLSETVIHPWIFSRPELPVWGKTLLKMALIVGLFGPVRIYLHRFIDSSLATTRNVTESVLLAPRLSVHLITLALLFVLFHRHMHGELPWQHGAQAHHQREAEGRVSRGAF